MTVEPSVVSFGAVGSADTLWAEAVVTNRFAEPLIIEDVSRLCSCVQSGVAQKELAPGEATTLTVGWRMAGKRGAARETVMLRFRVGERTELTPFVLTATVRPQASYSPERLRFAPGDPAEQVLTVRAERPGHAVRALEATCSTKAVTATVDPGGQTVRVAVDRAVPVPAGLRHTLMVRVDGFDGPWLEVPIQFDADESQPRF